MSSPRSPICLQLTYSQWVDKYGDKSQIITEILFFLSKGASCRWPQFITPCGSQGQIGADMQNDIF